MSSKYNLKIVKRILSESLDECLLLLKEILKKFILNLMGSFMINTMVQLWVRHNLHYYKYFNHVENQLIFSDKSKLKDNQFYTIDMWTTL